MAHRSLHLPWLGIALLLLLCSCAPRVVSTPPVQISPSPTSAPVRLQPTPAAAIAAQTAPRTSARLHFERISVEQGLSEAMVKASLQDSRGLMWFATEDGLNKFDGQHFTIYKHNPNDPNSLSNSNITALLEDHVGFLWIGTFNGLNQYDPDTGRFTRYTTNFGKTGTLSNNVINAIAEDREGSLWVGTSGGLNRFDRVTGQFERYLYVPGNDLTVGSNSIRKLLVDHDDQLWVGTNNGLDRLDRARNTFIHFRHVFGNADSLVSNQVRALAEDRSGRLWIGTDKGVERFDQEVNRFVHFRHNDANPFSLPDEWVNTLYADRSGRFWVGLMNGGLCQMAEDKFYCSRAQVEDTDSLSVDNVLDIYEDRSGTLWVGTNVGGVNRLDPGYKVFEHYWNSPQSPYRLSDNHVFSILAEKDGTLWLGYDDAGVDRVDLRSGLVRNFRNDPNNLTSLSGNAVQAIYRDSRGELWIGTANGLNHMVPGTDQFTRYFFDANNPNGLNNNWICAIVEDAQGNLWLGTYGGGVNRLDRKTDKFTHYVHAARSEASLSTNYVTALYIDSKGTLWVGTLLKGLERFDSTSEQFTHYINDPTNPQSLSDGQVMAIYEDRSGTLWVGTTGGLNRFDREQGTFRHYRTEDGLPNDYVYALREDAQGYLWMSTNKGLARMDPRSGTFKNFDVKDGLQSNEFNINAVFASDSGEMFFGGISGISAFYPETIRDNPYVPPVVLTSLTQHGEALATGFLPEATHEITLRWPENYFDFEFAALDFTRPEQNQYAYRLDGFDRDWNYTGAKHYGAYTNIPGGTYTLRLKGSNNDSVWNNEGISVRIQVIPPFWATRWFQGGAVLLLAASIFAGVQLRLRSVQRRNRQLEHQVQQRTAEIENRSREMEALYRAGERMHRLLALDRVLQTLVDVAVDMLQAEKSAVFTWERGSGHFSMRISRGFSPAAEQLSFPECGLLGETAARGEPLSISDAADRSRWDGDCPEVAQIFLDEGIRSFLHLPLIIGQEIFGVFHVGSTRPNAFDGDALRLFAALAQRAVLSIENAQLLEQAKELVIVEERSRLARDLHDSAKQKAFAALAQLGAAEGLVKVNPPMAAGHLEEAETLVYEVIQELTFLIQEMYPIALKEKGLANMLRDYVFEWESRTDIRVDLQIENERRLPLEIEQAFYRVVQESLANIARHSQARQVCVCLVYCPDALEIHIRDDGRGFDPLKKPAGIGLRSMQERLAMIHGTMNIESAPGRGTSITARVPFKSKA